jgi:hypothetical protein
LNELAAVSHPHNQPGKLCTKPVIANQLQLAADVNSHLGKTLFMAAPSSVS